MVERTKCIINPTSCEAIVESGESKYFQTIIRFLPLLFLYVFILLAAHIDTFQGDEERYVMYATNLSKGYYSPKDIIYLWNGPGYPIVLLPFVILELPWLAAKLLNPLFLFISIIYFYFTLRYYMIDRTALFLSYLLGLYPPFLRYIHWLLTEELTIFLVCGFLFHFCKVHKENRNSWIQLLIASFYLGYLALTKIFFGYVILIGLLLWSCIYLWKKGQAVRKTVLIYLGALLICVPYLFYTYSLTGKIFYWGNSGGHALYLMSTAYEGGFGDWNLLDKHRKEMYNGLGISTETEINDVIDAELKKRAIKNIIRNPSAYFKNWIANVGRLWFNYPFSYETQSLATYFYMLPNMFLFVLSIICIYPTYLGRSRIPFEIYEVIVFCLISLTGSSLIFILNRQIWPIVPAIALWILFIFTNVVRVEINK